MNYNKKTIYDVDVKGKKVLLRCDFNVPQNKETGEITSNKRIVAALPTIRYLLDNGAAVIACSHLGKPKGEWKTKLTLAPVAQRLSELLGQEVIFAKDIIGEDAHAKAAALQPGQIMLLENLRFDIREEKNDADFAKALADMAEIFVSDAFGTVHRAHASTAGVAAYLPAYSGLLVDKELSIMGKALDDPKRPFVAVLGGAKVSDKIAVINNLLEKADTIIIGGGMAYTFLKAQGKEIGKSLLEEDRLDYAREMIQKAADKGVKFLLPVDHLCAAEFSATAEPVLAEGDIFPYSTKQKDFQLLLDTKMREFNEKIMEIRMNVCKIQMQTEEAVNNLTIGFDKMKQENNFFLKSLNDRFNEMKNEVTEFINEYKSRLVILNKDNNLLKKETKNIKENIENIVEILEYQNSQNTKNIKEIQQYFLESMESPQKKRGNLKGSYHPSMIIGESPIKKKIKIYSPSPKKGKKNY